MSITKEFDTIAAISTPLGEGAIGIVRLSGSQAVSIAKSVFKGKDLESVPSHILWKIAKLLMKLWFLSCGLQKPLPVKMW